MRFLAAILPLVAMAQKVCVNDTNFKPVHLLDTESVALGVIGTCELWRDRLFQIPRNNTEECLAPVRLDFGVKGNYTIAAYEMQSFMIERGCCGEVSEDSEDADYPCAEHLMHEPCSDVNGHTTHEDDGICTPCYERWQCFDNGECECMACFAADVSGCHEHECAMYMGNWSHSDHRCKLCNEDNEHDCEQHNCPGRWFEEADGEGRCAICRPEDHSFHGCNQTVCEEHNHSWYCDDCYGSNCTEECWCKLCDPEGMHGWWSDCSEEHCVEPARWIVETYEEWSDEHQDFITKSSGQCARCVIEHVEDDHWLFDLSGCIDRDECESLGMSWECDEFGAEGAHCCQSCTGHSPEGCWDYWSCTDRGHHWTGGKCVGCKSMSRTKFEQLESVGYRPNTCH